MSETPRLWTASFDEAHFAEDDTHDFSWGRIRHATADEVRAAVVPLLDLEAAWERYYQLADRRHQPGLTALQVRSVVYAALGLGEPTSQGGGET